MLAQNEVHCDVAIIHVRHNVTKPEEMHAYGQDTCTTGKSGGGGLTKMPKVCTGRHRCSQKYIIIPGKY